MIVNNNPILENWRRVEPILKDRVWNIYLEEEEEKEKKKYVLKYIPLLKVSIREDGRKEERIFGNVQKRGKDYKWNNNTRTSLN